MLVRVLLLIFGLFTATAAQAEPVIRGLFVGIDKYYYSAQDRGGQIPNLQGAVADTRVIKNALVSAYQLNFDERKLSECRSEGARSITLTDYCATRDAIFVALSRQIEASAVGDTLIFYFAGHGSRIVDDERYDQASGYNATLLPTDAREPGGTSSKEILDRHLREVIDVATARGVNVVTIFDSCNSGTAVRGDEGEGWSRGINATASMRGAPYEFPLQATGPGGGYRVHFGAAADHEEAREVRRSNSINGVFTTALAREIIARPNATFGDLATAVRLKVEQAGHKSQNPQAEGALRASLLGGNSRIPLYEVSHIDGNLLLEAGSLLGMTEGSTFALFNSQQDALADERIPVATGSLTKVEAGLSLITPDSQAMATLPRKLVAREIKRAFGSDKLRVSFFRCRDPAANEPLVNAMEQVEFADLVEFDDDASHSLARFSCTHPEDVDLYAKDRTMIANLGKSTDPDFVDRLNQSLLPIYNAMRLASLPLISEADAQVGICVTHQLDHTVGFCPEPTDPRNPIVQGRPTVLTVTNLSDRARHIYVLVVDDRYAITQMIPANGGIDPPMASLTPQKSGDFAFDKQGSYRFFVIASDAPINTTVLEQPGVRVDYTRPCDPVRDSARLCGEGSTGGNRGGSAASLGQWTISVKDVEVSSKIALQRAQEAERLRQGEEQSQDPAEDQSSPIQPAEQNSAEAGVDAATEEEEVSGTRIVGGRVAPAASAPWQTEIFTTYRYTEADTREDNQRPRSQRYLLAQKPNWEKIHRCGGVYIGDRFVLTAAHCVSGIDDFGEKRRVRLGTQDLTDPGVHFRVSQWQAHRDFVDSAPFPNDIALLLIKADNLAAYNFDLESHKIRLLGSQANDREITPFDSLRVTGWGRTKSREQGQIEIARDGTRNRMSAKLLQIEQRKDNSRCRNRNDDYAKVNLATMICATSREAGEDSCNGDSGGPMTVQRPGGRVLVGLVSWGKGCALENMPAIYTDVSSPTHRDWIEATKKILLLREAEAEARRGNRR